MVLPFTVDQFLSMAAQYNQAIWPLQIIAYGLGIAAIILAGTQLRYANQLISAILAVFWLWLGIVFFVISFSRIWPVGAVGVGVLFILESIIFVLIGVVRPTLTFQLGRNPYAVTGALFLLYALLVYPITGMLAGHVYPQSFGFGVAPCPTTICTSGLLLLTTNRLPKYMLVIPLLWSLNGIFSPFTLGLVEDIGMAIAGILGTGLLLWRDRGVAVHRGHRESYA